MERAVVASRAGDLPEVVRHEDTGLLVPPGELAPLTAAVLRLLNDDDLRRRLGQAGRRLVLDAYSREHMLKATEEVYARVLAGAPGGGA